MESQPAVEGMSEPITIVDSSVAPGVGTADLAREVGAKIAGSCGTLGACDATAEGLAGYSTIFCVFGAELACAAMVRLIMEVKSLVLMLADLPTTVALVLVVEGGRANPVFGAIVGLVRSANLELSRSIRVIALGEVAAASAMAERILASPRHEREISWLDGRMTTARLRPLETGGSNIHKFDECGTLVVTGGCSGIALATARHMVERHGATSVLLCSRSGAVGSDVAD